MTDTGFLVLLRVEVGPGRVPGSRIVTAACGHRAYMSPTSWTHYQGEGAGLYTVCSVCIDPVETVVASAETRLAPGALDEIEQAEGVGQRDQLQAFAKAMGIKYES